MKSVNPIFELHNVVYEYNKQLALKDLNMNIFPGERIAILGANGSGKSTLLKILDGLYFSMKGEVIAFGEKLNPEYFDKDDNFYNFRKKVGFVFQDPDVQLFSPTVYEEVTFAPLHLGLSKQEVIERSNEAIKKMGISHLKDRSPYMLSGGEKKKVALASILSYSPKVWLFDEPTAGLDPRSQSNFLDFILDLGTNDNTIVTATHDLEIVDEIADRVIILSETHQLVRDGKPKEILSNLKLLRKYNLAHEHRHKHEDRQHKHVHTHRLKHDPYQ